MGFYKRVIATVLAYRWVEKVGKYRVKLGFVDEKSEEVWMTECQLDMLEHAFEGTPNGWSTDRRSVVGYWNERGYYAYSRLVKQNFIQPTQYDLSDLNDEEGEESNAPKN